MRNSVLSQLLCSDQQNAGFNNILQDNQESDIPILMKNDVNEEFMNGGNLLLDPKLIGTNNYYHQQQQQQQHHHHHLDYGCFINTIMPYDQLPELVPLPGIDSSSLMPRPRDREVELGNYLQYCPPPTSFGVINKNQQMLGSSCDDEDQTNQVVRQGAPVLTMGDYKIKLGVPSLMISKKKRARQPATEGPQPFNVLPIRRSQKLGDKIALLHQLVCPYGKTDTASVLQEACTYIRNAQQDIRRLSNSYLEATALLTHKSAGMNLLLQQPDLRNIGLCLVPASISKKLTKEDHLSSDYHVASTNTAATLTTHTRV